LAACIDEVSAPESTFYLSLLYVPQNAPFFRFQPDDHLVINHGFSEALVFGLPS